MSDIRTLTSSDEAAYTKLGELISEIAGACANKLSRTLIPKYRESRAFINLSIDTTTVDCDGNIEQLHAGPVRITGWNLKTAPFFLSDPTLGASGAVFLRRFDATADLVDRQFYGECLSYLPVEMVLPIRKLSDVYDELIGVLTFNL